MTPPAAVEATPGHGGQLADGDVDRADDVGGLELLVAHDVDQLGPFAQELLNLVAVTSLGIGIPAFLGAAQALTVSG